MSEENFLSLQSSEGVIANMASRLYAAYLQMGEVTVANEDDVLPLFESWIPVMAPFHPEQADHYILGVESTVWLDLEMSVQGYYKRFANLLAFNTEKIDRFDPDFVQGHGKSYGFEFLVRRTSDKFYWSGSRG